MPQRAGATTTSRQRDRHRRYAGSFLSVSESSSADRRSSGRSGLDRFTRSRKSCTVRNLTTMGSWQEIPFRADRFHSCIHHFATRSQYNAPCKEMKIPLVSGNDAAGSYVGELHAQTGPTAKAPRQLPNGRCLGMCPATRGENKPISPRRQWFHRTGGLRAAAQWFCAYTSGEKHLNGVNLETNELRDFPDERLGTKAKQTYFLGLASAWMAVTFTRQWVADRPWEKRREARAMESRLWF